MFVLLANNSRQRQFEPWASAHCRVVVRMSRAYVLDKTRERGVQIFCCQGSAEIAEVNQVN
jgi:hypothetical protein